MAEVFGVEVFDPPTGWTVLEVIVVAKAMNSKGREAMFTRTSANMWAVEALGMISATQRAMADDVADNMLDDPEAPDEDEDEDEDD